MKKIAFFAVLMAASLACFADDGREARLKTENIYQAAAMCDLTPKEFFQAFIGADLVVTKPVAVKDSVSYFRPHMFKKVSIYNMKVDLVFGYLKDQIAFKTSGQVPAKEFYGFVVEEGMANVQAQLTAVGSTAKTRLNGPGKTNIICIGE